MYYSNLVLKNYRSYDDYAVEFSPGVNIVVGPNASGKTNLLEAVMMISLGSSFRDHDRDLIGFKSNWARIDGLTSDGQERVVKLTQSEVETKKELLIDDVLVRRITQDKTIPLTLFEPEHLRMVSGMPELRRDFLDGLLEQTQPGYKATQQKYRRALYQRNRLLKKEGSLTHDDVFVWDVNISEYGAAIAVARQNLVDEINKKTEEIYEAISGEKTDIKLQYMPVVGVASYASNILKGLHQNFGKDRQRGYTGLGPHREDFLFMLKGRSAAVSASRGESRTLVLMCKLIELFLLEESRNTKPILLLDDVFSELDSSRRRHLTEYLKDYQTIITTTDADAIVKHFIGDYNVIATGGN